MDKALGDSLIDRRLLGKTGILGNGIGNGNGNGGLLGLGNGNLNDKGDLGYTLADLEINETNGNQRYCQGHGVVQGKGRGAGAGPGDIGDKLADLEVSLTECQGLDHGDGVLDGVLVSLPSFVFVFILLPSSLPPFLGPSIFFILSSLSIRHR